MNEKAKETATIGGAAAAGAAVGAAAVLGVDTAMASPRPTSQADDLKAQREAASTNSDNEKDYTVDARFDDHTQASGISTSQGVNVHVDHREIITPTQEDVTPEVKVLEYKIQINEDGSTTDVAVLSVDGHNAIAIDATGDHVADVVALDLNGDGIYQDNELIDVTGQGMEMGELAEAHLAAGGTIELSLDPELVAPGQMLPDKPLMADSTAADFNPDFDNNANVDDFLA